MGGTRGGPWGVPGGPGGGQGGPGGVKSGHFWHFGHFGPFACQNPYFRHFGHFRFVLPVLRPLFGPFWPFWARGGSGGVQGGALLYQCAFSTPPKSSFFKPSKFHQLYTGTLKVTHMCKTPIPQNGVLKLSKKVPTPSQILFFSAKIFHFEMGGHFGVRFGAVLDTGGSFGSPPRHWPPLTGPPPDHLGPPEAPRSGSTVREGGSGVSPRPPEANKKQRKRVNL